MVHMDSGESMQIVDFIMALDWLEREPDEADCE
jgi:hypothetical protein